MPATFKITLAPRADADGQHDLRLRVTVNRVARFRNTGFTCTAKQWNEAATLDKANWLKSAHRDHAHHNQALADLLRLGQQLARRKPQASADELADLTRTAGQLAQAQPGVGLDAVVEQVLSQGGPDDDFLGFFARDAARHAAAGSPRTAKKRQSILRKLQQFTAGGPLAFAQLTVSWVKDYQAYLSTTHQNSTHTANKELQVIHTVLKQAIHDGLMEFHRDPFLHVRLKHPKTKKPRLTDEQVKQLEAVEVKAGKVEQFARDCWLLQFHLQGARVGDIIELRRRDVSAERVEFTERKTGKRKSVPRHPRLDVVLSRYQSGHPDGFLLPFLDAAATYARPEPAGQAQAQTQEQRRLLLEAIESATAVVNRYIKKVAARAGIDTPITSHTARHSFADAARRKLGGNVKAIQEMLNHGQLRTTEIYLSELAGNELDDATRSVYD